MEKWKKDVKLYPIKEEKGVVKKEPQPVEEQGYNNSPALAAWNKHSLEWRDISNFTDYEAGFCDATSEEDKMADILDRIIGSMSLERVERFDLLEEAKTILEKYKRQKGGVKKQTDFDEITWGGHKH